MLITHSLLGPYTVKLKIYIILEKESKQRTGSHSSKIVLKIFKLPAYRYFGIKRDFFSLKIPHYFCGKKIVKFPLTVLDFSLIIILSKVEGNFKNLKCFHFPTFSRYHLLSIIVPLTLIL